MAIVIRTIKEMQSYVRQPGALLVEPAQHEQIAEDYRKAGEHHASQRNFTAASWYLQLYRMYSPDPEPESQDVELDWSSVESGQ